jgi:hypothetical protein
MIRSDLGEELVTIFVGDKRKKFVVHKKLLCDSADYFKGVFTGDFEEARKAEMYMPEDNPGAFSLYVTWLYRSSIPMANTEAHLENLYELYFLADKLCLVDLKDKAMDTIQDMALKYDLKDQLITPELVTKVMKNTPTKWAGLRSFCICHMVNVYLKRHIDQIEEDDASESEFDSEFDENDNWMAFVMSKDMKTVFEISKNCNDFRFLNHFVFDLSFALQKGTGDVSDPRKRDEEDPKDRCYFHCHKKDFNCRLSQDAEAGGSFLPKAKANGRG